MIRAYCVGLCVVCVGLVFWLVFRSVFFVFCCCWVFVSSCVVAYIFFCVLYFAIVGPVGVAWVGFCFFVFLVLVSFCFSSCNVFRP